MSPFKTAPTENRESLSLPPPNIHKKSSGRRVFPLQSSVPLDTSFLSASGKPATGFQYSKSKHEAHLISQEPTIFHNHHPDSQSFALPPPPPPLLLLFLRYRDPARHRITSRHRYWYRSRYRLQLPLPCGSQQQQQPGSVAPPAGPGSGRSGARWDPARRRSGDREGLCTRAAAAAAPTHTHTDTHTPLLLTVVLSVALLWTGPVTTWVIILLYFF